MLHSAYIYLIVLFLIIDLLCLLKQLAHNKHSLSICWAFVVHGVAKSWTRLSNWTELSTCIWAPHVVQSLSCVQLFATSWMAALQVSLSFTISWSLLKPLSVELVMPSNHLILCHPLLLTSIFPSIKVFSNESALSIRWPNYWSFSFSMSPSREYSDFL